MNKGNIGVDVCIVGAGNCNSNFVADGDGDDSK